MSQVATAAELITLTAPDLIEWSDNAARLLKEQPEAARAEFARVLATAQETGDKQATAFAHAALARADVVQMLRSEAINHARQAQALVDTVENPERLARLYQTLGRVFKAGGKSAESLTAYRQAVSRFSDAKDARNVADCYSAIGTLHLQRHQHDQALTALLKACQLSFSLNDQAALAYCYHKLASVYYEQDMLDQSLAYAHKSLEAAQLASDDSRVAEAYNMLGVLNKQMEQYEQALRHYTDALQIQRSLGDKKGEGDINHNMGLIFEARDQPEYALHYYAHAMALRREIDDTSGLLRSYAVLGTTHAKLRRFDLATNYLRRALQLAQDSNSRLMEANVYKELADVHSHLGNYERAFAYHRQFADLRHHIFNEERVTRFAEAQAKFTSTRDERRAEIYRNRVVKLEAELAQAQRAIDQVLVREADVARRLEAAEQQQAELHDLRSRIIRALSHEFRTPLAIISNATYMLDRYSEQMEVEKQAANRGRISQSVTVMKELLDDICWIDAATTEEIKVVPAPVSLKFIAGSVLDQFAETPSDFERIVVMLPKQTIKVVTDQSLIQQILFHLLSNGLKFSTNKVHLKIGYSSGNLLLQISDTGIGIHPSELAHIYELFFRGSNVGERRGLGLGLAITHKLVAALNATVSITSDGLDKGTIATVLLPCREVTG